MKDVDQQKSAIKDSHSRQDELTELISDARKEIDNNTDDQNEPLRNANILIVEDSPITQMFLQKILEQLGHQVFIASNGIEALNIVKDRDFDLIFMDLEMPRLNGLETMTQLAQSHAPIPTTIALTATPSNEDIDKCLKAGMMDHITKPFSIEIIERALKQWL